MWQVIVFFSCYRTLKLCQWKPRFVLFGSTHLVMFQNGFWRDSFPRVNGDLCCSLLLIPATMLFCHCITHYFNNMLRNKLALIKKIWARVLQASFWPGKDVSILHPTWKKINWDFLLKWPPAWLPGFLVKNCESLQKRAVTNTLNHSVNNNICNVLWEKAAGMIMEEEVGRKKEPLFKQSPFLKL